MSGQNNPMFGRKRPDMKTIEYRTKQSISGKKRFEKPTEREKQSRIQKIVRNRLGMHEKLSRITRLAMNRPEVKEKHRKAMKLATNRPEARESNSIRNKLRYTKSSERRKTGIATKESKKFQFVMKSEAHRKNLSLGLKNYFSTHPGARSGDRNSRWLGGCFEPYSSEWNGKLQEQIRDRDDHLCQMPKCKDPFEHRKKHSVHHIDYNKKNNTHENLITLCRKCHPKTHGGNREDWTVLFWEIQKLRKIVRVYEDNA